MTTNRRLGKNLVWTAVLTVLVGVGTWMWTASRPKPVSHIGTQHHALYQCPMHPQIVQDHPGFCPICHMRLEKIDDDTAEAPSAADGKKIIKYRNPMDPTIFSDHPTKDSMGMDYIPVYADETSSAMNGVPGKTGFTLSQERQQLIGVRSSAAEMRLLKLTLRLPGRVLSGNQVLAQLLELDAGGVKVGMKARLQGPGGEEVEAQVVRVDGSLDSLTRSFGVVLRASSRVSWSMPGVYCLVLVESDLGTHLAVPQEAVLDTGERQVVFVTDALGHFEPRQVVLGRAGDNWVEVKQGIKEGELVVTSANFLIDSESRFRAALEQFQGRP